VSRRVRAGVLLAVIPTVTLAAWPHDSHSHAYSHLGS
jgi:hypothetical protein